MRLSQAMQENQSLFGGVMVASIAAGEASGRLPEVLGRLSAIIRDEMRLVSSIRGAISYPLVLLCVTGLVLSAMIFFVLPQFGTIYASSRAPTPALTQLLLDAATLARGYWYLMLSAVGLIGVALWRFFKSDSGRRQVDQAVFRLPFTNRICSSLMAGRMFRLQGVMLNSGVPMLDVLQLTKYSVGNRCYRDLIDQIEESVVSGRGMSPVLSQSSIVPSGAADMIVTAEANGQLGSVLQTVGEFYESEGEQYLRDAVKIAEPAIIVVVGLIVGSIVLAVMLPMLDLSTANGA
jgi:type II secretory pathway component PulF